MYPSATYDYIFREYRDIWLDGGSLSGGSCKQLTSPFSSTVTRVRPYHCPDRYIVDEFALSQFQATGQPICHLANLEPIAPNRGPTCPSFGNPVTAGIGNKFQDDAIILPTRTGAPELHLYYNSRPGAFEPNALRGRSFGTHWGATYQQAIYAGNKLAVMHRANGKGYLFTFDGTYWLSADAIEDQLMQTASGWEYHTTDNQVETYDTEGKLLTLTDLRGNTQSLTYDDLDRVVRVEANTGEILTFNYDSNDRIIKVTDQTGRVWGFRYDAGNNLEFVDNPDGTTRQYHYEDASLPSALTGITDERGIRYATFAYDALGRAILSTHAGNSQRVDITYNDTDGTRRVANSLGQTSTYSTTVQLGVAVSIPRQSRGL